ncbi:phosphate uptake regulator PhoU [Halorhabdus amylolytica]|uniref:phosphate uptake regulator PhoU n=1 Tax=Halorhabdus amylolytica TaxID=2559573 RepID=UPI0010AAFEBD|nr:phosphate uptake regulator PhoU [Halorhabdus amylolytica]
METRKVQLSGGTTYTVSLPKAWANEHGIDAGSVLRLHPNADGSLLVETTEDRSPTTRSTDVDIMTASDDAVAQRIRAMHAVGYDSVTLLDRSGHSADRRAVIEAAVAELSGFELLSVTDTRIELTNLIDAENVDVRKSVLRLRLVTLGMHRDAVNALLTGDEELARRVVDRDSEADKLFAMVTRHFRRSLTDLQEVEKLNDGREVLFEYFYASRQFERVADHAEKIAQFALDEDTTVPPDLEDNVESLANEARGLLDAAADVILNDGGVETAHRTLAARDRLTADIESLDRDLYTRDDPRHAYVVGLVLDSIRRTAEYGANVAGIAIQQETRTCGDDALVDAR